MKYKCTVCQYEYDEDVKGTSFAELDDDYECPVCGADKSDFEKE